MKPDKIIKNKPPLSAGIIDVAPPIPNPSFQDYVLNYVYIHIYPIY